MISVIAECFNRLMLYYYDVKYICISSGILKSVFTLLIKVTGFGAPSMMSSYLELLWITDYCPFLMISDKLKLDCIPIGFVILSLVEFYNF